ncbi:MAG: NUDIX hydrolase [Candidatus Shapirobacteria bacterium]|jgi:8-oxo-dGTP pyrophosphatase MutT (NUDIX family)
MNKATNWKTVSQKFVYESKWLALRHDEVIRPDGNPGEYDVLVKKDFVVIISKINNKFVLVEQDRYPVGDRSLEFSQGSIVGDETPEDAARREFEEETGYQAGRLKNLGKVWLACGHSQQCYSVFLVEEIREGNRHLEGTEADMKNRILSEEELKLAIRSGEIKDASTITAYCLYTLSLDK